MLGNKILKHILQIKLFDLILHNNCWLYILKVLFVCTLWIWCYVMYWKKETCQNVLRKLELSIFSKCSCEESKAVIYFNKMF